MKIGDGSSNHTHLLQLHMVGIQASAEKPVF